MFSDISDIIFPICCFLRRITLTNRYNVTSGLFLREIEQIGTITKRYRFGV